MCTILVLELFKGLAWCMGGNKTIPARSIFVAFIYSCTVSMEHCMPYIWYLLSTEQCNYINIIFLFSYTFRSLSSWDQFFFFIFVALYSPLKMVSHMFEYITHYITYDLWTESTVLCLERTTSGVQQAFHCFRSAYTTLKVISICVGKKDLVVNGWSRYGLQQRSWGLND